MMRVLILIAAFVIAGSSGARAQSCTATIANLEFSTVNLTAGTVFDTSANVLISCTGVAGQTVRTCPSIGTGSGGAASGGDPRNLTGTPGGAINYNLYQDAGRATVWGSVNGTTGSFDPPALDVALGLGGTGEVSTTIYGRIFAAQQSVPPGSFSSSFAGLSNVSVASMYSITNPTCATIATNNATTSSFNVSATYAPSCTLTGGTLNFGSIASTVSSIDAATSISVRCSSTTPYTMSMGNGLAPTSNEAARRSMQKESDRLLYNLYRDSSRTLDWGSTQGVNVLGGTGTGSTVPINVYGRVPQQSTPAVGTYTDTVIVTLDY